MLSLLLYLRTIHTIWKPPFNENQWDDMMFLCKSSHFMITWNMWVFLPWDCRELMTVSSKGIQTESPVRNLRSQFCQHARSQSNLKPCLYRQREFALAQPLTHYQPLPSKLYEYANNANHFVVDFGQNKLLSLRLSEAQTCGWVSDVSSANHIYTLCFSTCQPSGHSSGWWGSKSDPEFPREEVSIDVLLFLHSAFF